MGFFKKVTRAVSRPIASATKSIVKNAVPLTAAYLTGGASLSVMKPSGGLFDKAFSAVGMGPQPQSVEQVATEYAQQGVSGAVNTLAQKTMRPPAQYTPSRRINPKSSQSFIDRASGSVSNVVSSAKDNKMIYMIGGGFALLILILAMRRK